MREELFSEFDLLLLAEALNKQAKLLLVEGCLSDAVDARRRAEALLSLADERI